MNISNQSNWLFEQFVTNTQMNTLSNDIYDKLTALTQNLGSGILYLNGSIMQGAGNIILPAGGFRFSDATYIYIPYQTGIFGFTEAQTVTVSGNGYIVARYSINPTVSNATNYSFPTSYYFVATPLSTDCVICTITAGNISGYGNFLINTAATQAEVNTGTISNKAVVPSTLQAKITANGIGIVASGSNANGWWVKYANGLIQQWGGSGGISAAGAVTKNLPIAFTGTWAASLGTLLASSLQPYQSLGYSPNGTTQIIIINSDPINPQICNYVAIGY